MKFPGQFQDRGRIIATALAGAFFAAGMAAVAARGGAFADFMVLWAAHHTPHPYDSDALRAVIATTASHPMAPSFWPYPYPPTFLLLTSWFALLSYAAAFVAWTALGGAALVGASRHVAAPLVLLSPWVLPAVIGGQTSLVVGALIYVAFSLPDRPSLAGVLLGVAACVKPQFGVFIPLGLLIARQWRTIAAAALTVGVLGAVASAAYGPEAWVAWLQVIQTVEINTATIPQHLDLASWPLKALALAVGAPLLWRAFAAGDADAKLITACGLALLVTPHSLWYNAAILAPGAVGIISQARWRGLATLAILILPPTSLVVAIAIGLAAAPQLAALRSPRA